MTVQAPSLTLVPPTLPVAEVFGPVWQGEGPHTGRTCGFLRLGLCNLACEWCDTPYTWDSSRYDVSAECPDTAWQDVVESVLRIGTPMMVLTGGEPMLHAKRSQTCALGRVLAATAHVEWHVETNGTIPPPGWMRDWAVDFWTVSPKINTRDGMDKTLNSRALPAYASLAREGRAAFKFVVTHRRDLGIIHSLTDSLGISPGQVWVMPEGTSRSRLLSAARRLAPHTADYGYNLSLRQHVLLYGAERKR